MAAAEWYHAHNNQQQGPFSLEEMRNMVFRGAVSMSDLVWTPGMADWQPASAVAELSQPGVPPVSVSPPLDYRTPADANSQQPLSYQDHSSAVFQAGYANFGLRLGEFLIDYIIVWVGSMAIGGFLGIANNMMGPNMRGIPTNLLFNANPLALVCNWLYFALMESSPAQATLGKMAVGVIVTDEQGKRISFGRATGRYFAKILSGLICWVGYLMMLWNDKSQTLHDQLAKTLVMRKPS